MPFRNSATALIATALAFVFAPIGAATNALEEATAQKWIAGSKFNFPVPSGTAPVTVDLEYSKVTGGTWTKLQTGLPAGTAMYRYWATPTTTLLGDYHFRIFDPKASTIWRAFPVTMLAPAGSLTTGPFVHSFASWDRELLAENANTNRITHIGSFRQAAYRLAKAEGGNLALPKYDAVFKAAKDEVDAGRENRNAVPILVSRPTL